MKLLSLLVIFWAALAVAQTEIEAESEANDDKTFVEASEKELYKVSPVGERGPDIDQNLMALQGALDNGASTADILQSPALRKNLIRAFENNPMSQMPRDVLRTTLAGNLEKNPLGKLTKHFPRILDFMVDFMRHPRAISQLVKVLDRPRAMRNCGIASILLMLVFYLTKRKTISDDMSFLKRNLVGLCFSLAFMSTTGLLFWVTFQDELAPALEVFRATFL
jgi:hypothetical protein